MLLNRMLNQRRKKKARVQVSQEVVDQVLVKVKSLRRRKVLLRLRVTITGEPQTLRERDELNL